MEGTFLDKIMNEEDAKVVNEFSNLFNSNEWKEKFEKIDKIYNSAMNKTIKELESKAAEGDIQSILMLKYKDIVSKMLEMIDKTANTKELNPDIAINCLDDIIKRMDKLIDYGI